MSSKIDFPAFGYLFIQSAMLFGRYGLKYEMPFWVTWFPTIILGIALLILLFIAIVGLAVAVFAKSTTPHQDARLVSGDSQRKS